jgi:hypothetical protein
MTVTLTTSQQAGAAAPFDRWFATTGINIAALPKDRFSRTTRLVDLPLRLEDAFMTSRELWWELGRAMAAASGAEFAHTPTCGAFGSDFGVMLAWDRLVREEGVGGGTCLVICDDPWLFRHLAQLPGIKAAAPPTLHCQAGRHVLRGVLARGKTALRMAMASLRTRRYRGVITKGDPVLLVYGHPESNAAGHDAYFGDLMKQLPALKRLLHTDCPPSRAAELGDDNRSASLHGWGNPLFALTLILTRWHPTVGDRTGPYGWLIRRAAAVENSGGGPAMNRWQQHCQRRFLGKAQPDRLCWPWENHGWERALCREARKATIPTIGYQHTVIGPHQINYSPAANADGMASLPDHVVCDGPAYRDELAAWGVPENRLSIGGALRFERPSGPSPFDPDGPVFVPLSAIPAAAARQMAAARLIAESGRTVLVKEHPMYPHAFNEDTKLQRTDIPMTRQNAISGVLYSTGASGFEALLAGLPVWRLLLDDRIAIDVLPQGFSAPVVTLETVCEAVSNTAPVEIKDWDSVLSDPDAGFWKTLLTGELPPGGERDKQQAVEGVAEKSCLST